LRLQLYFMKNFITTCREREILQSYIGNRSYLMSNVELYSLSDFIAVTNGTLLNEIRNLTEKYITHIKSCQVYYIFLCFQIDFFFCSCV
jgi:hypothetical protein